MLLCIRFCGRKMLDTLKIQEFYLNVFKVSSDFPSTFHAYCGSPKSLSTFRNENIFRWFHTVYTILYYTICIYVPLIFELFWILYTLFTWWRKRTDLAGVAWKEMKYIIMRKRVKSILLLYKWRLLEIKTAAKVLSSKRNYPF